MLIVKVISAIHEPVQQVDGFTVVVQDGHGNPLVLVQELANDLTVVSTIKDGEDFQRAVEALGYNKLVINEVFEPREAPPGELGMVPVDHLAVAEWKNIKKPAG
jgi:predicted butyrate kinase (DUF1464 family)